ncbi:MAG: replication initiator protein [Microviridae sp.]|nr:MAG: replication initiator protein [Microviridae sp.]
MCLYPRIIINRKYITNKKNGGIPPIAPDPRVKFVPVGCGKCVECKKQRSNNWRIRLMEETRSKRHGRFINMTFSEESLIELENDIQQQSKINIQKLNEEHNKKTQWLPITGYELDNEIATLAVRRFLERYRKKYKKSIRHWLVTELGQNNTERLHIHGIIWTQDHEEEINGKLIIRHDTKNEIEQLWKYGNVNPRDKNWENNYCNERTVNYIVKYINKTDKKHKYYNPIILTSSGIGNQYIKRPDSNSNKYKNENTKETYTTRQGVKMGLPMYYRNKLYTDNQKEQLWLNKLNKEERWVIGIKVDTSKGEEDYNNVLKHAREVNKKLGYGNDKIRYEDKAAERQRRNLQRWIRISKIKEIIEEQALRSIDKGETKEQRTTKIKNKPSELKRLLTEIRHNNENENNKNIYSIDNNDFKHILQSFESDRNKNIL